MWSKFSSASTSTQENNVPSYPASKALAENPNSAASEQSTSSIDIETVEGRIRFLYPLLI